MDKIALIFALAIFPSASIGNTNIGRKLLFEYQANKDLINSNYTINELKIIPVKINGSEIINPQIGSIDFTFIPNSDLRIQRKRNATSTLFKLGEQKHQFKIILYHTNQGTYLEFRHDATDHCAGAQCQRSVSTSSHEPNIVKTWRTGEPHRITVSWNFIKDSPSMDLYIDGRFAINQTKSRETSYSNFTPKFIYINGDDAGNLQTDGMITELRIFRNEYFAPPNALAEYIQWRKDNGIWEGHERYEMTRDAPPPLAIGGGLYSSYNTPPFQNIYEGSTPSNSNSAPIEFKMLKNECETRFFNIYSGINSDTTIKVSISDLKSSNATLPAKDFAIRTTHNWWQASDSGVMKNKIPSYKPELLIFDEIQFLDWMSNPKNLPNNQSNGIAHATIHARSSKQFSIHVCLPHNAAIGSYTGEINIKPQNGPELKLPVKMSILDAELPNLSIIAAIYHESRFDINRRADNYVPIDIYESQLKNIKLHGFNGLIAYGDSKDYIQLAKRNGLDKFFCYSSIVSIANKITWLKEFGYSPIFLGEDEAHLFPERLPAHIKTTAIIHKYGGLVAAATDKKQANILGSRGSKLNIPILDIESKLNPEHYHYIEHLLLKGREEDRKDELIYWQATDENPLKNRFYAGYFLYLTNFGGIAPYVFQKVRGNPFDDFSDHSGKERSLHLAYPGQQGPIDTLQWEALREGLDDYRLLTLITHIIKEKAKTAPEKVHSIKSELTQLLAKYKNMEAYQTATADQFDSDRKKLISMIMVLIDKEREH